MATDDAAVAAGTQQQQSATASSTGVRKHRQPRPVREPYLQLSLTAKCVSLEGSSFDKEDWLARRLSVAWSLLRIGCSRCPTPFRPFLLSAGILASLHWYNLCHIIIRHLIVLRTHDRQDASVMVEFQPRDRLVAKLAMAIVCERRDQAGNSVSRLRWSEPFELEVRS